MVQLSWIYWHLSLICCGLTALLKQVDGHVYSNQIAAEILGGPEVARKIAELYSFKLTGQVPF